MSLSNELTPLYSANLPDFSIDINVCRNPMCLNFGVSETDIEWPKLGYEYRANKKKTQEYNRLCKRCGQSGKVYSNSSTLNAFHACLKQSYPFASCPKAECDNHSKNIFDYRIDAPKRWGKRDYYINTNDDKNKRYQARCSKCKSSFMLSNPKAIHTDNRRFWKKELHAFLTQIVNDGGPSTLMNTMFINPRKYYSHHKFLAHQLQNFNNYHIANYFKHDYKPNDETVYLYTDCIVPSLKVFRENKRSHNMKIIVTVMRKNHRSLIVAANPMFEASDINDSILEQDEELPIHQQQYAYLKHLYNSKPGDRPLLKVGGYFMQDHYAYMGHFLTVRKILSRVNKMLFYVDGEVALYNSALIAFSDKVKAKNCDIMIVKSTKYNTDAQKKRAESNYWKKRKRIQTQFRKEMKGMEGSNDTSVLRRFDLEKQMKRINNAIKRQPNSPKQFLSQPLSQIHKLAINNANQKDKGQPYWADDPLSDKKLFDRHLLWLTRDEARMNTEEELRLYVDATLFYVDNIFSTLRNRSSFVGRPSLTASGGRSFNNKAELPMSVIRDMVINTTYWNFFLSHRQQLEHRISVASEFGIKNSQSANLLNYALDFKYDFKQVKRLSK